ncbi:MAG: 3'(2'),5'-bisphosphate nucleotidase CysQ [Hyphomicrobiales bacterium]|nr:3'(2'),5'-bisphosphate nucleotidase CysQ [Hyphomicrobiales bacterium]
MIHDQNTLDSLLRLALEAGDIIMKLYGGTLDVSRKEDRSPVTEADLAANQYIVAGLRRLTPNTPIIAEENVKQDIVEKGEAFWLVDPLDGTKSYIRGTGEFTVNIGRVENGRTCWGVVYVPAKQELYYVDREGKARFRVAGATEDAVIQCRKTPQDGAVVVASTSHRTPETDAFIETLPKVERLVPAASSMKFCLIARAEADIYPRFGPTMEWDTAAGQAVLEAAGGRVETPEGNLFRYGKPDYRNGNFIAYGA